MSMREADVSYYIASLRTKLLCGAIHFWSRR